MEDKNRLNAIDFKTIITRVWHKKKLFFKVIPVVFVLSVAYILCIPRTYTTQTKMAPEISNPMAGGSLSSLASTFGINLGNMQNNDAITPLLYPELIQDNKFVFDLFSINVKSTDGEIETTYYDYLKNRQKQPWWGGILGGITRLFAPKDTLQGGGKGNDKNPYYLSRNDEKIVDAVRKSVNIMIDKKTGVITITTTAQDPLICKTLADSVRSYLQGCITEYRTSKARIDVMHYKKLTADAKANYEKARQLYGGYADANTDVVLASFRAKQTDLENDMQLKFNTYTAMNTQYQASLAKLQENTPAFTMIQGAAVPYKASGPKRMVFVLGMMFFAFIILVLHCIKDDIVAQFKS
ncbi:MAG: chain-length determining protein [Prevotella sp.]|uniref:chain-length determining protein n=1 Tax=Prevotella sp. TaxID=59823 RepID=UPI002A2C43C8|nr:chain-length determining protein [Prevotella sp.]MDD7318617.1 chain-length determining protein [Prevotellaceae bacterium]MDY4019427.1 chain-length determining protein [Prevotella sp.]